MTQRTQYIANCIERILAARCIAGKSYQRVLDLAAAIEIADREDEAAAHRYLRELLTKAEEGLYEK